MHVLLRAASVAALLLGCAAPGARAQRAEHFTPTITLYPRVDPIEDTDYSRLEVESVEGGGFSYPARLTIQCFGIYPSALVGYDDPVVGATHLVWRFDSRAPDTLALPREHTMRVYGAPGLWMVMYRPLGIVQLPDSVLRAMLRDAARSTRLVVRLSGPELRQDSYFSVAGLARGADRLSCLGPAAAERRRAERSRPRPRVLGETVYYDEEQVDEEAVPLDSAATEAALRAALSPADLSNEVLGDAYIQVLVNAAGQVDSAEHVSAHRQEKIEAFLRTLRFRPARVNGEAVPVRVAVYLYREDPRRSGP
ncbi:MAG TPA: hypothetical protein VFT45_19910 [Longimicrobium sp.]|nr:hypothetical protein [Longimicrobium sp.]